MLEMSRLLNELENIRCLNSLEPGSNQEVILEERKCPELSLQFHNYKAINYYLFWNERVTTLLLIIFGIWRQHGMKPVYSITD